MHVMNLETYLGTEIRTFHLEIAFLREEVKKFQENTGGYILYARARLCNTSKWLQQFFLMLRGSSQWFRQCWPPRTSGLQRTRQIKVSVTRDYCIILPQSAIYHSLTDFLNARCIF